MPSSAQHIVGTTAIKLDSTNGAPHEVHIHCASGSIYIDGSGVTSSTGYRMDNGDKLTLLLLTNEELWAVTSSGTSTVYVLISVL
jgi:hypothetical protein